MDGRAVIPTNAFQTPVTEGWLASMSEWVRSQFMDFMERVPLLRWMASPDRPRAADLPRDALGRIVVDIAHPHILEDVDYFRPAAKFFEENGRYTFLKPNPNPRSEYGRWFTEERRRCREGYVRESDGEWVTGHLYWFLNYCPMMKTLSDGGGVGRRVEGFPDFWEGIYYRFHYMDQARRAGRHCIELSKRGSGKAHPYDETVYTPDGVRKWGDIKVGDMLFGDDGAPTRVVDIPFDEETDIYRVRLRDGRTVECSSGHLWNISKRNGPQQVVDTMWLKENYVQARKVSERNPGGVEYTCSIAAGGMVEWGWTPTRIDPYTFGLLLGDGCFRVPKIGSHAYFSSPDCDFDEISRHIPYAFSRRNGSKCAWSIHIPGLGEALKSYGLFYKKSVDKFIPDEYKYNSSTVRREVLSGLLDTDGYVQDCHCYEISTASPALADDIMFIARSLGYNASKRVKRTHYMKDGVRIDCLDAHVVTIYSNDALCKLGRKNVKARIGQYATSRIRQTRVVGVEYVGRKRAKCVTVDNASHCYMVGDFVVTHNSFSFASILSHNLILGEDSTARHNVTTALLAYSKEYLMEGKDGTFRKFTPMLDFLAANTSFPRRMMKASPTDMTWMSGYRDENGNAHGARNTVLGVSIKDDESKIRGKRGNFLFEEMGAFAGLLQTYDNLRDSVKDGDVTFGQIYMLGTAGDSESDFAGARTILYDPDRYDIYALENVYDRAGEGGGKFGYFFPSYMSRKGCIGRDGNSDVTKALRSILEARDALRGGNSDSFLRRVAEQPVTPSEAIVRVKAGFFPLDLVNERLRQLDSDPRRDDDVYVGDLVETADGVEFRATADVPVRRWPVDNDQRGAVEIWEMPQGGAGGRPQPGRYVIGVDGYDNDQADSDSLFSVMVLDLFTDRLVAEYTGRRPFAEDCYALVYRMCLFYNAVCCYESNKKMMFSYFSKRHALWMLADCPQYLRDRQLVKYSMFGSSKKGVSVNAAINSFAVDLIRDWLQKPVPVESEASDPATGEASQEVAEVPNCMTVRSYPLLQELAGYGPGRNTDRVSALAQAMLYREQYVISFGGGKGEARDGGGLADDEAFERGWRRRRELIGRRGW